MADEQQDNLSVKIEGPGVQINRTVPMSLLPSLMALLMGNRSPAAGGSPAAGTARISSAPVGGRVSVAEYLQEKDPKTLPQIIATLGRYAELHDDVNGFTRDDIRRYMTSSRVPDPANFHRDFQKAIRFGLITSAGGDNKFQVTRTGIDALDREGTAEFSRGRAVGSRRRPRQPRDDEGADE